MHKTDKPVPLQLYACLGRPLASVPQCVGDGIPNSFPQTFRSSLNQIPKGSVKMRTRPRIVAS